MAKHENISLRDVLDIAGALSDENRLRAICALHDGELCVCQIVELLGLAPSTVSKHMSVLRQARLVETRKEGRWVYYRLAGEQAPEAARDALRWALDHAAHTRQIQSDDEALARIKETDREEICRKQGRN